MATIYLPRRQVDDLRQPLAIELAPRRRHIPRVLDIERKVYPRPWTMTLFLSEIVQRSTRFYIVAKASPAGRRICRARWCSGTRRT